MERPSIFSWAELWETAVGNLAKKIRGSSHTDLYLSLGWTKDFLCRFYTQKIVDDSHSKRLLLSPVKSGRLRVLVLVILFYTC